MKKYLSIGCGKLHEKSIEEVEWVNLDKSSNVNPDIVRDITRGLPFNNEWFDHIKAYCCLGQIVDNDDFLFVMNEIWRVLKSGGNVFIYLPHKDREFCYLDPFNQRRTNEEHWLGFDETNRQWIDHGSYYGFKPWRNVEAKTNPQGFLEIWMTK